MQLDNPVDLLGTVAAKIHVHSSTDGAVTETIAADPNEYWCIDRIDWSYSAQQAAGCSLKVTFAGATVWEQSLSPEQVRGTFRFADCPLHQAAKTKNVVATVVLSDPGGAIVAKIDTWYH